MLRGSSCTAYVDVPNQIIEGLIENLMVVSGGSKSKDEFYVNACEIVNAYNIYLRNSAAEDFGQNLDWFRFELYDHPFMSKYGVKVSINWKKFMKFLEDYLKGRNSSMDEISIHLSLQTFYSKTCFERRA